MTSPVTAATSTTRCSPNLTFQVLNDGPLAAAPLPPTTLEVLQQPPAACDTAAAHAARLGLPRIVAANASSYPPISLNSFRSAAARAPADSAPALWYWQLTGEEWRRDGHSYDLATKVWRRMPAEQKAAERERERKRARSGRKRRAADGAQADSALAAQKARGAQQAWVYEEDWIILHEVEREGPRWSLIVAKLPGRTIASVRERWRRLETGRKLHEAFSLDPDAEDPEHKHRCSMCGRPKFGHVCPAKTRDGPHVDAGLQ